MVVTTSSSSHLLRGEKRLPVTVTRFKDGELYVKIHETRLKNKKVTVIAGFQPPADNLMELLLVLDGLRRLGARIRLIITYFGYARQDRTKPGEALAAAVVCRILRRYTDNITVIDMHSKRLKKYLTYKNIVPITPFLPIIPEGTVVVAPDKGAIPRARHWQRALRAPLAFLQKTRPAQDVVEILSIKGSVRGKNVLIVDDMIATGGTIIEAARVLKQHGANKIYVAATHGIFAGDALKNLAQSPISRIFVTNTLPQKKHPLLTVIPIDELIKQKHI